MLKSSGLLLFMALFFEVPGIAQPNWVEIKANATFVVPDETYSTPYLQSIQLAGWEDGLFMTRDGKNLYSTYLPLDAFSWLGDFVLDPICFDFGPYFRPPLLDIDTVTNIFDCPNFMQSDIIIAQRNAENEPFEPWSNSNLQESFSFDGGAHGVLLDENTFDVFVYTKDGVGTESVDLMFMHNVPINPTNETAVTILSSPGQEDNPHIERLNETTLLLFFDRDRYMYYSMSSDNGESWEEPTLITNVLNDQAPFDVQPHLWNDGADWWVYFCAQNDDGVRCIYKSKQLIPDDWDSWGERELVIEPNFIIPAYGNIFGIGEPTLSEWGDLSFVVVYGDATSDDTTDVFDCDPWFMPKKDSPLSGLNNTERTVCSFEIYPNPASNVLTIGLNSGESSNVPFKCYNALGELVREFRINESLHTFDISGLPKGLYFLENISESQSMQKFIKF